MAVMPSCRLSCGADKIDVSLRWPTCEMENGQKNVDKIKNVNVGLTFIRKSEETRRRINSSLNCSSHD